MTTYLIVSLLTKSRPWAASVLKTGEVLPSGYQSDDFLRELEPGGFDVGGVRDASGANGVHGFDRSVEEFDRMIRAVGLR